MKRKYIIILGIVVLIGITFIFTSYGFFNTKISGNEESKLSTFKNNPLSITYADSTNVISGDASDSFTPGSTITKTFTVTNPGTSSFSFGIILDNVTNTFTRTQDITYTVTLDGLELINDVFPTSKKTIIYNQNIEPNETLNYILTINYINSSENQIVDSGAEIGAKLVFDYGQGIDNLLIYGNSVQNGTPTPDNPIEIESVGDLVTDIQDDNYGKYKIPIEITSPNLLPHPYTLKSGTYGGIDITINNDGSMKLNGTSTGVNTTINTFRLKAGTYTISGNPSPNVNLWLRVVGSTTSAYYNRAYNGNKGTLTITEDSDMYVYITVNVGITLNDIIIYPMVNEGTMDLEYSKYFTPGKTNIYLDEPLRKIGDYTDYLDWNAKKIYRNVKKVDLNTTLPKFNFSTNWDNDDYTTCYFYTADKVVDNIPKSNYFPSSTLVSGYGSEITTSQISTNHDNNYIYIKLPKSVATSKTELNTWLSTLSTPVRIYYQLANPVEEDIAVTNLSAYPYYSNINVDTTIEPSNIEITSNEE